jgi:hypothetical protein
MLMGKLKKQGQDLKKASDQVMRTSSAEFDPEDTPWGLQQSSKDSSVAREGPRASKSSLAAGSSFPSLIIGGRRPSKERPSKQAQTFAAALGNVEDIIAHVEQTRRSSVAGRKQSAVSTAVEDATNTSPQRRSTLVSREDIRRSPSKQLAGKSGSPLASPAGDGAGVRRSVSRDLTNSQSLPRASLAAM